MKLKLDENLDERLVDRIAQAGHDVSSVRRQGLGGAKDDALFRACREEGRAFVTLDLDFSSVLNYYSRNSSRPARIFGVAVLLWALVAAVAALRFPPEGTEGIVVLRLRSPLIRAIRDLVDSLIALLKERSPRDQLWIIEPGRVRIHLRQGDE